MIQDHKEGREVRGSGALEVCGVEQQQETKMGAEGALKAKTGAR